ncbi:MAG: 6-carboxytetrahydropterin synthase [Chitinophagales bacterium]|nr:6-carboxytetrahydropterin synthase [Chitinophagales bacterium]
MVYLTRKEHFNAAHRLYNEDWSESKNLEVYGKCANANWHGHNYDLFVTVKGEPDESGFLMNAHHLSKILKKEIVDVLDHKNMNMDVPFLKDVQPTSENLVKIIWQKIQPHLLNCKLHCVKLVETENIFVEYYGE